MKKLIAVIALASSMGLAYAAEPVALTDVQMDNVSAGGTAWADGYANAFGSNSSFTNTYTQAVVLGLHLVTFQATSILKDSGFAFTSSTATAN